MILKPTQNASDLVMCLTTTDSQETAVKLSEALLESRLAACIQIDGPIQSIYRWESKIESATEFRLSIKSRRNHCDSLKSAVQKLHPYDVPQIVFVPIADSSTSYQKWVNDETS